MLVLEIEVFDLEGYLLNVGVFVHFVLVEDGDSAGIVVSFYQDVDLFSLDLSPAELGWFFIGEISQLFKSVFLHDVKLDLCSEGI